jgi:peptidyl-prolyl cis-trans isomerase SurA
MVWSKAVKDTAGLEDFYENNKEKYMWGKRIDATVYQVNTEDQAKDARKLVKKMQRKGYSNDDIASMVCPAADTAHSCITWKSGLYEKGDNQYADQADWKTGVNKPQKENGTWWFIDIHEVQAPRPKTLDEARGLITSDYQNYLENQWVKSLRDKYRVVVNEDVWSEVK